MAFSEEHIDDLISGYMDGQLSSMEKTEFEAMLASDAQLAKRLAEWRAVRQQMVGLNSSTHAFPNNFAEVIIAAARRQVVESGDSQFAPWVMGNGVLGNAGIGSVSTSEELVEPSSIVHARYGSTEQHADGTVSPVASRTWQVWATVLAGMAASILVVGLLVNQNDHAQPQQFAVLPQPNIDPSRKSEDVAQAKLNAEVVENAATEKSDVVESVANNLKANSMDLKDSKLGPPSDIAGASLDPAMNAKQSASVDKVASGNSKSTEKMDIQNILNVENLYPSDKQLQGMELGDKFSEKYLLVIDVTLPSDVKSLEAFHQILAKYDIPRAEELNVEENTVQALTECRMIAGKKVVLPDSQLTRQNTNESDLEKLTNASLVYVRGHAERLDAAMIEMMRSVEEFPDFSFDLALDAPSQRLANELKYIQEAKLPTDVKQEVSSSLASVLQIPHSETGADKYGFMPSAPRNAPINPRLRREGRPANSLEPQFMNPITSALFIVRHANLEMDE